MTKIKTKRVDSRGRISLPAAWRKRVLGRGREVVVVDREDRIEVLAKGADLSRYIDSVGVDVREFVDYHALRRELRKR